MAPATSSRRPRGEFMGMTVFKNGSLARERIRDACGLDLEWLLGRAPAHPHQATAAHMMLPWLNLPEITPPVLTPGVRTAGLSEPHGPAHVRAVIEAQMMSMALHSRWMRVTPFESAQRAGAATNREIMQIAADVFGVPVSAFAAGEFSSARCCTARVARRCAG